MLNAGMRKVFCTTGMFTLMSISGILSGQEVRVSDPSLAMVGDAIHINYDILNSTSSQEFRVDLVIEDAQGNKLNANTLTGDVGDRVRGGSGKRIIWDYRKDYGSLDGDIFVKVNVKALNPPEPRAPASPAVAQEEQFSRAGLILQSAAFPGLGLTRYKGGPHWVKGVLAYGSLAGSIYLNRKAVNTYAGIIRESDLEQKTQLYNDAIRQDNISEVLAYAAIAIWISDLVWTIAGTSDLNRSTAHERGARIKTSIDPVSRAPMLALTYQF